MWVTQPSGIEELAMKKMYSIAALLAALVRRWYA
jgi:hypothetical protein